MAELMQILQHFTVLQHLTNQQQVELTQVLQNLTGQQQIQFLQQIQYNKWNESKISTRNYLKYSLVFVIFLAK